MKKVIALLLACLFMGLALAGCNSDGKETNAPATEAPMATDIHGQEALMSKIDWSSMDFDGEEIVIMQRTDAEATREWGKEDVGEDELDIAIAERNEIVQDVLNIEVVNAIVIGGRNYDEIRSNMIDTITRDINNKLHEYDIAAHLAYVANQPALKYYQANLLDTDTFPNFDFKLQCWNQAIINNVAVNGTLYSVAGDMNISMFNKAMIMWHNKTLYEELRTSDDPEDIQVLAMGGGWTYSELYRWSSQLIAKGDNGDCGNIYGVYVETNGGPVPSDAVPYAFDISLVKTNADGTHSFNVVGNSKAEQAMKDWIKLYNNTGNGYKAQNCSCQFGTKSHFVDGNVLFMTDILYLNESYNIAIREMKDTYSILPIPKYTMSQEQYASTSQDNFTLVTVLDHSESSISTKGEAISAYLQYGTEYSYTYVRGFYFEKIVKPRFFGTDDSDGHVTNSITIFNTIVDNLKFEFHTLYSPMLNDVAWLWRDTMNAEQSLSQQYNANKTKYDKALRELDTWLGLTN